jgi:hypothetical protein
MHVPAIGHSLARSFMPQIDDIDDFLSHIKEKGIESSLKTLDPDELKSTQQDFDANKVFKMMQDKGERKPIITSNDGYVLDGHHRWLDAANKLEKIDCHVCNCSILELLHHAKRYTHQAVGLNEDIDHKAFGPMLDSFVSFASEKLGIKSLPNIRYKDDNDDYNSFAAYHPGHKDVSVSVKGRHPMDVFRSVAHELVHHSQNEFGRLYDGAGETGSPIEDEANYMAGRIMRLYAKANPSMFSCKSLGEAVFVVGGPCSGKDRMAKQLAEQYGYGEIDVQSIVSEKSCGWERGRDIVVSASADQINLIEQAQIILEQGFGFTTTLLFIDTTNDVSKMRNEARAAKGQRVLSEGLRFEKYTQAQKNKKLLAEMFERDFHVIDNSIQEATSAKAAQNVNVKIKIDGPKQDKPKKSASTKKATKTSSTQKKPKKTAEQIKMDMEAQKQRYAMANEKTKQKFAQDSEDKKLNHERETQAREVQMLHHQSRAGEFQAKIETIRSAMMRLQPVGKNYKKIHGILKKQMAGALLGMRKYQKTALDIHAVKPVKPDTAAVNEAFKALCEVHRDDERAIKLGNYIAKKHNGTIPLPHHQDMDHEDFPEEVKALAYHFDGEKDGWPKVKPQKVNVSHLIPLQPETDFDGEHAKSKLHDNNPITVIKHFDDHYIMDGNHRVVGKRLKGEKEIDAYVHDVADHIHKLFEHAGEWGTDELRSNYQVQTPGQPVVSFVKKPEPEMPIEEPAPASNSDYIGQTVPMANSSGPSTPTRSAYSGLSEHVQKWASNNNTIERFKARYGNLWEAKILETAVFLDKQKLEDQPRSLRMVQEALKKPGNDTFLNNKSKKIIKRKQ